MSYEIPFITDFPDFIPNASYFRVYRCPSCPAAHVVLFDDNDVPFAQFVVARNNVDRLIVDTNQVFECTAKKADILPFKGGPNGRRPG